MGDEVAAARQRPGTPTVGALSGTEQQQPIPRAFWVAGSGRSRASGVVTR